MEEGSIPKREQVQEDECMQMTRLEKTIIPPHPQISSMLVGRRVLCLKSKEDKCQGEVLPRSETCCATSTGKEFIAHY